MIIAINWAIFHRPDSITATAKGLGNGREGGAAFYLAENVQTRPLAVRPQQRQLLPLHLGRIDLDREHFYAVQSLSPDIFSPSPSLSLSLPLSLSLHIAE